jgi:DNA-binding NarL/FixJ family response regulator
MTPIRVLIVDDHPILRAGLLGLLASRPEFAVVGEAANGLEAVALVERVRPDVVLIDLRMPEMGGVAAIRAMRALVPDLHVLVLTIYDSDADILRAVEAGATGYLLKETPSEELFAAIRATAVGQSVLSPTVASRLVRRSHELAEQALSSREIEVLEHVARGSTNRQVARDLSISEATVKTHLLHVFTKLGVDDRTAAVTTAVERGVIRL